MILILAQYAALVILALWAIGLWNAKAIFGVSRGASGTAWGIWWTAIAAITVFLASSSIFPVVYVRDTIIPAIVANPMIVAVAGVGYVLAGSVVAYLRWSSALALCAEAVEDKLANAPKSQTAENRESMIANVVRDHFGRGHFPPRINDNKARFSNWLVLWPFVGGWMIIHHPVRSICRGVYNLLSERLQAVSDRKFAKFSVETKLEVAHADAGAF